MRFDIITIFPNYFEHIFGESILKRAREANIIETNVHDLRKYTEDKRGTVDDKPFGGGPGMLLMVEPVYKALKDLSVYPQRADTTKVILTSATGNTWNQAKAETVAHNLERVVIICGRYEGVDQRVSDYLVDEEVSLGNFVLTGGELAAAAIVDSASRLLPGVLGNEQSLAEESHSFPDQTGEYPQYTRPASFETTEGETWEAPDVLLSGNHEEIKRWREQNRR